MVEYNDDSLDAIFHALADPTRRSILQRLQQGPQRVGDLAEPFAMSLAAASKHIKVLESAGLIRRQVQGRTHLCQLEAAPMHAGMEWLRHYERYWNERLDALEAALRTDEATTIRKRPSGRRRTPE